MPQAFGWDSLKGRVCRKSIMTLLSHELCCGLYSVRVGTLLLTFMSFSFSSCIIAFDWMAIHFSWKKPLFIQHENLHSTPRPVEIDVNSTWDEIFPWLHERFLPLWIIIPVAVVSIISLLGFVGALFKWSILLIPYCIYRFCWLFFTFLFFLPFLLCEFLVLLILSIFPKCPSFLVVFTWIVTFFESLFVAIIVSELIVVVLEFHIMSIAMGCYQISKKKNRVDEEATEVLNGDDSVHVAIAAERQRNYQTIELPV